jgi:hypothetical protein
LVKLLPLADTRPSVDHSPASLSETDAHREVGMESWEEWAARVKAEKAARTPEQTAADEAWYREWVASLPVLDEGPLKPGEVRVIFYKRQPKKE